VSEIDTWWPQLHEQIRRVIVNGLWSPVAPFSLGEIERLGGPQPDDAYWERRDVEAYLPRDAISWLIETQDFKLLSEPKGRDPRAVYLGRGWPYRQP
jgi:hypothetical protein